MKKVITISLLIVSSIFCAQAQITQEKVVELAGKSKNRGYLGNLVVDDTKQQFDMVFVTKDNNRKVEYEVYQFDYDFNLLNNFKESDRKIKAKSKSKTYRGKDYEEIQGVTAEANMSGKLVLKKLLYIYNWNWWRGEYETDVKLLDKEKPKELAGDGDDKKRKLFYTTHRDIADKGELLVCALVNPGAMDMLKKPEREYLIMHIDKDLNTIKKTPLTFAHPQSLLFSKELEETDEWILVFAPFSGQGYKKLADPSPTNLTFVKINATGNITEKFNFQTKCNEWAIYDVFQNGSELYLYGGGNINKPESNYTKAPYCITADAMAGVSDEAQRASTLEGLKYEQLQIVKIANGKTEFVSATSIEEINTKGIKPANQKKLREFDGKKFILNSVNITSNGDFFISGQDFSYDATGKVKGRVYKDLFLFHYDKSGMLKRYYGVENTAKSAGLLGGAGGAKSYPSEFAIYESPSKKDLFWNVLLVSDIDVDCSTSEDAFTKTTTCVYTPLYQGRFGKIGIADGEISEFKTFGGADYYLYVDLEDNGKGKDTPWISINGGKQLVYIARQRKGGIKGNERWGNSIWFGKFDPASEK